MNASILDLLSTAILVLDSALQVTALNPAAENLLGISARQAVGLPLADLFSDARPLRQAIRRALDHGACTIEHELQLTALNGHPLWLSAMLTPIDAGHLLLEFHPVDTRIRVNREDRLHQQQHANRELLRNLSHEIRNPLGGLRGAAQLLERELETAALKEYTQVIIQEADRLQALMDRFLASNRLPRFRAGNIHQVLERVRALVLAEMPGVRIRRDYDTSLPELTMDEEQLIQATLNITRNAAQILEGSGEIILRTRVARQVVLARRRHPLAIEVQISDNGPGIPEDLIEEIFNPLVSGRSGGTGLGLTIAQMLVHAHHGIIQCESRPGRTTFTLLLPVIDASDPPLLDGMINA